MKFLPSRIFPVLLLSLVLSAPARAQLSTCRQMEDSLAGVFRELAGNPSEMEKQQINSRLVSLFLQTLGSDSSFYYPFPELDHLGILYSPDSLFRICQWNLPHRDGTQTYTGFIQDKPGTAGGQVHVLTDGSASQEDPANIILPAESWFGCLYHEIIPARYDSLTYYMLLGTDFNNLFTAKKIIDVLWFDSAGNPRFGLPLIMYGDSLRCRLVFEYNARAKMSLRYHPERKMIIFDHLSPPDPSYAGQYQFYGPDFSYDALEYREGLWYLREDVDVRNQ